jgi:hypothetical protein
MRIYKLHCANVAAFRVNAEIDFGKTLTKSRYCIKAIINIQLNDDKTK